MKLLHVGRSTRKAGNKGGVEKLASYMERMLGCELTTVSQLSSVTLTNYDAIIADDALAGMVANQVGSHGVKVISIIHGAWAEFALRNNKINDFKGPANEQGNTWTRSDIIKVAVSESAAHYARVHHGVTDKIHVVPNAIDTDLFKPVEHHNKRPVVIYAANDYNKDGQGRLGQVAKQTPMCEFRYLNAKIGEEQAKFAQGDIFIQCSHYEGNSFAALEAMSCGLPVVASCAGVFELTDFGKHMVGEITPWNATADEFARRIAFMLDKLVTYDPRAWILENANLIVFKRKWLEVLNA